VRAKTGKGWKEWFEILDDWDVKRRATRKPQGIFASGERDLIQLCKKDKKGKEDTTERKQS